jgi:hypothetical protein
MTRNAKAASMAGAAFGCLAAAATLASALPGEELVLVAAGVLGYLVCGAHAVALWRIDDGVFERRRHSRPGMLLVLGMALASAQAAKMSAQQTLFNVPSADVLQPGKLYTEVDELFRPTEPRFSSTTWRGVVGVFPRGEAGINIGGLTSPGPATPTGTVAVKLQPLRAGGFALTAGGYGLFFLDASDGDPSGLGFGFASYRVPGLGTRIEFGGWYSSAGYALPRSAGGALASFEQPLPCIEGLTLAADWWSGESSIGYLSSGLIYTLGPWSAYASYAIKNGDSAGDGGLIELGYAF